MGTEYAVQNFFFENIYFTPWYVLQGKPEIWYDDNGNRVDNFGPHNPVGDAKKALNELNMKKGGRIVKYNVDSWELASRVSWNKAALHDWYFCGLPLH